MAIFLVPESEISTLPFNYFPVTVYPYLTMSLPVLLIIIVSSLVSPDHIKHWSQFLWCLYSLISIMLSSYSIDSTSCYFYWNSLTNLCTRRSVYKFQYLQKQKRIRNLSQTQNVFIILNSRLPISYGLNHCISTVIFAALIYCGLVVPFRGIHLGQRWFR